MKTYNEIDIPLPFEGDCEFHDLNHEFQERDKAIVELLDELRAIIRYASRSDNGVSFPRSETLIDKYEDFVTKTRVIYGM